MRQGSDDIATTVATTPPPEKESYNGPSVLSYDLGGRKHFTMDSVISECPDCGKPLSVVLRGDPVASPVSRIHMEKCARCPDSNLSPPCFCGKPPKPEYCGVCPCRECCSESSAKINRVIKGEIGLWDLVREGIRERKERAAKAGGEAKEAAPGHRSGFKSIGEIFEDAIPS